MNLVIIGSGNVASILGRRFHTAGHEILQIVSRNASAASELAYEWNTESANYLSLINKAADVYIIAVADDAIPDIAAQLGHLQAIVVRTAASVSRDVLADVSANHGVIYPLQTLRKDAKGIPQLPLYIDASNADTKKKLELLANSISYPRAQTADDEQRMRLHLAGVFVNNFSNHLYALMEDYCKKERIPFEELLPLIRETVARLSETSPRQAQTGPARRHDQGTMEKHLTLLDSYPVLKEFYQLFSASIGRFN